MGFYSCDRYVYIDGDDSEVERNIYTAILFFWGYYDRHGYEPSQRFLQLFLPNIKAEVQLYLNEAS